MSTYTIYNGEQTYPNGPIVILSSHSYWQPLATELDQWLSETIPKSIRTGMAIQFDCDLSLTLFILRFDMYGDT